MKHFIFLCGVALFAASASASTVDFNNYPDQDDWTSSSNVISSQGLDFTSPGDGLALVYDGASFEPSNGNGTPALVFSGTPGDGLTISLAGGGAFTLNGFDLTISWGDSDVSDNLAVVANYAAGGSATDTLTLGQGLQTYNLSFVDVDSVTVDALPNGGYWSMDNVEYNDPVTATPEPGSFLLLGSGLLALAGAVRRRLAA